MYARKVFHDVSYESDHRADDGRSESCQAPSIRPVDPLASEALGEEGDQQDENAQGNRDHKHADAGPVVLHENGDEEDPEDVEEVDEPVGQLGQGYDGDPEGEGGAVEVAELQNLPVDVQGHAGLLENPRKFHSQCFLGVGSLKLTASKQNCDSSTEFF